MMTIKPVIAVLVAVGLAGAPFAAEAKKHSQIRRHPIPIAQSETYGISGISATQPRAYGSSGSSVGTVTAPSIGSYSWPSVGVTNSVPTWSNTNPPARR
ncbi:hypothetical protein [Bradyrhizobium sp. ARR65]|uniref:hypothetical protein n=1 Tax=Bradyrhizobium sp. ARR65 TaxID=1040989 RepID=UPI000A06FB7E|nr:hypothetical protein [Bradyrhizobium sp. ARR65]